MREPTRRVRLGRNGHRVVARLAEVRLSDRAAAGVKDLLGDATLVDVANWADEVRRARGETAPWHYVDIPIEADGFDAERDGRGGDNVIDAIDRFRKVLADPSAPRNDRVEALKFLAHLVGDLHQPLHCCERDHDRGGNGRLVFWPGRAGAVSLHGVWDTYLVNEAMRDAGELTVYAGALNARISPEQAAAWSAGTATAWANEAHQVAVEHAYADITVDGPPPLITDEYVKANTVVVEQQLQRAGVRLASVLDEAFAGVPTTTGPRDDETSDDEAGDSARRRRGRIHVADHPAHRCHAAGRAASGELSGGDPDPARA